MKRHIPALILVFTFLLAPFTARQAIAGKQEECQAKSARIAKLKEERKAIEKDQKEHNEKTREALMNTMGARSMEMDAGFGMADPVIQNRIRYKLESEASPVEDMKELAAEQTKKAKIQAVQLRAKLRSANRNIVDLQEDLNDAGCAGGGGRNPDCDEAEGEIKDLKNQEHETDRALDGNKGIVDSYGKKLDVTEADMVRATLGSYPQGIRDYAADAKKDPVRKGDPNHTDPAKILNRFHDQQIKLMNEWKAEGKRLAAQKKEISNKIAALNTSLGKMVCEEKGPFAGKWSGEMKVLESSQAQIVGMKFPLQLEIKETEDGFQFIEGPGEVKSVSKDKLKGNKIAFTTPYEKMMGSVLTKGTVKQEFTCTGDKLTGKVTINATGSIPGTTASVYHLYGYDLKRVKEKKD
jgi:hypothetical protein